MVKTNVEREREEIREHWLREGGSEYSFNRAVERAGDEWERIVEGLFDSMGIEELVSDIMLCDEVTEADMVGKLGEGWMEDLTREKVEKIAEVLGYSPKVFLEVAGL